MTWKCNKCGRELSSMLGDNEIPERCYCGGVFEELQFDDTVEDEHSKWTQVCEEHSQVLPKDKLDEVPIEGLICGVEDCQKEAKYYYTIEESE